MVKVMSMSGKVHLMADEQLSKTYSTTMCGRGIDIKGGWKDLTHGPLITCKHCKRLEAALHEGGPQMSDERKTVSIEEAIECLREKKCPGLRSVPCSRCTNETECASIETLIEACEKMIAQEGHQ